MRRSLLLAALNATLVHSDPVRVTGVGNDHVYKVSAGTNHTCALNSKDTVWCWGDNQLLRKRPS